MLSQALLLTQTVFAHLAVRAVAGDPVGGIHFLCGLFQAVKLVSLCTGNVQGVVVGAIGGGIACGMGW